MLNKTGFASDNNAGAHPRLLQAMQEANKSFVPAYGDDEYTERAEAEFKKHFGANASVFFVFNGSAANVLSLSAFLKPWQCVFTAGTSHLENDECGALERFSGNKIVLLPPKDGKITPAQVESYLHHRGDPHHVQPGIISITQTTECGSVYAPTEIRALADFAHSHQMALHVDGSRFSNACASLGLSLKEMSADLGVDVLSYGGTKNGLVFGEAIVVFGHPEIAEQLPYLRKSGLQLASKMRFIAAQFETQLREDLWLKNAQHANAMTTRLREQIKGTSGLEIIFSSQANAIFAKLNPQAIAKLQERFHFYVWNKEESVVRWMTSWETGPDDVDTFATAIRKALG